MLAMHPIDEPEVIRYINRERFAGILRGYVMTEDDSYVGYALFKEEAGVITVLDSNIKEPVKLDGIVRACIATGENNGNPFFCVNGNHPLLAKWWSQTFRKDGPLPTRELFGC